MSRLLGLWMACWGDSWVPGMLGLTGWGRRSGWTGAALRDSCRGELLESAAEGSGMGLGSRDDWWRSG
ncbi:MAG TPA: hypothetical protein VE035_00200 [Puia sp.]|nr:hypothetical protein [Puia sp.]